MSDAVNHNVFGTDLVQPVWNPKALWKTWDIQEIYTGTVGENRYVPKVRDHIKDPMTNQTWVVTAVDQITLIPTLQALGTSNSQVLSSQDLLFASGPGWPSQTYRIFIDDTTFPYRLDVDDSLHLRAVSAAYVKIVRGSIYADYSVVAFQMDAAGNIETDNIALDLVAVEPGWVNYNIKTIRPSFTNTKFADGDVLTVLVFSREGHLLSHTPLVVVNSNFIRQSTAPIKHIKNISLKSPYLSETNPSLLQLPTNWNNNTLNIKGVLHYSDGSSVELPIDGRKFSLDGWDSMITSIPGQPFDFNLRYSMDAGEAAAPEVSAFNNGINLPIRAVLVEVNNSYSVKLYAYPVWNKISQTFVLKWYLTNLDRTFFRDVSQLVRIAANSASFDGSLYGQLQRLQVSLNLRDVFTTYKSFVHTQAVDITLYGSPVDFPSPWVVKHNRMDSAVFGAGLFAKRVTNGITLASDIPTKEEWIMRFYENLRPITENPTDPLSIETPNKFSVVFGGQTTDFDIDQWDQNLILTVVPQTQDTVTIVFKRSSASGDLVLGVAATSVWQ